jgi:hypothetical protein
MSEVEALFSQVVLQVVSEGRGQDELPGTGRAKGR